MVRFLTITTTIYRNELKPVVIGVTVNTADLRAGANDPRNPRPGGEGMGVIGPHRGAKWHMAVRVASYVGVKIDREFIDQVTHIVIQ